jgi:parallel beta-helix repeat protein
MVGPRGFSLLLLVSLGALLLVVGAAGGAEGATVTVPDDFLTVQEAIDNANDYDTVYVKDGIYLESVLVWKPLTITGMSKEGTIIEFDDPYAMLIVANKVSISNLTVRGTSVGAGLILQASYCTIEDMIVRDNLWGLWVNRGYYNVVRDVQCLDNDWQGVLVEEADYTLVQGVTSKGNNEGINVRAAIGTTIKGCTLVENRVHGLLVTALLGSYDTEDVSVLNCEISNNSADGINIADTDMVTVQGCTVDDNAWSAIRFDRCNDVVVRGCSIRNIARLGIAFQGEGSSKGCVIEENVLVDEDNSWSKIIVHGVVDISIRRNLIRCRSAAISVHWSNNTMVSENEVVSTNDNASISTVGIIVGRHRAGVGLPPTNVTLLRNEVRNFSEGIRVRGGRYIDIIDCIVKDCEEGLEFEVFDYGDDPIVGGVVRGCTFDGCGLDIQGMMDVTVEDNLIMGAEVGIYFNATTHQIWKNVFMRNTIRDCSKFGLYFNGTNGTNTFHTNTFINNTEHSSAPFDDDVFNSFMNGNYWDDYEERYPDANITAMVWDTPYGVGGSIVMDAYPLAYPYDTKPPSADAGDDQTVLAGTIVTLNGTASMDDIVIVSWTWTFIYAGTPVELEGETTTFPFLLIGTYMVDLEVEDAWGNMGMSKMTIVVIDDVLPVADAGEDVTVDMGMAFTLNGSASTDNGFIVDFQWTVDPGGLDIVLNGLIAEGTIDRPGEYLTVLKATDEAGNFDIDQVWVHVVDTEPPMADAGRDFSADQGDDVTLYGGWSRDNLAVISWTWTFMEEGVLVTEEGETVTRAFPFAGVYDITLNVTDAAGNWDTGQLLLTIRDTEPPVADAGPDMTVDAGTLVTFDGTASTDNVGIYGFYWMFAEGSTIKDILGAEASYQFKDPGVYELELGVFDAAGNLGFDWIIVTVNAVGGERAWRLGPFQDNNGVLGGVRVEVDLNGTTHVGYTGDDGFVELRVEVEDLVSPASVVAKKEGWKDLKFDMTLDTSGDPSGDIPKMVSSGGGDDDDDDDDELMELLPWILVIVLVLAYGGSLLYLSRVAKENE